MSGPRGAIRFRRTSVRSTLRPEIRKVVDACRHAVLEELKPTRSQLERGFELHYGSYVADLSGCLYVADPLFIWKGDRLKRELESYRNKLEQQGPDRGRDPATSTQPVAGHEGL